MLDIGLEVKILRERIKMSAKDLAEMIGLSQSQMSRLEKGQRRIDTKVLARIAEALGVEPSYFFRGEAAPSEGVIQPSLPGSLGKEIRTQRRKRHLSVEDVALKLGIQKYQVRDIETGKKSLESGLAEKVARLLKLPPNHFLAFQEGQIQALEAQVARLNLALAETQRGQAPDDAGGERSGIPIFGSVADGYSFEFDQEGRPVGEPEEFLHLPSVPDESAFAVHVIGDSMEAPVRPSFAEGDLAVFSDSPLRSRDFALVRKSPSSEGQGEVTFRQVFFDPGGKVRLQPLNLNYTAEACPKTDVLGMWKLAAHLASF